MTTARGTDPASYLIVGGTTRSGTTSLFKYLAVHPQICASAMKETRFFLDADYPLESRYRLADGLASYGRYFSGPGIRLEATPDYLHSPGCAARVAESLADVRFVFSLRDPLTRALSWYRHARQRDLLAGDVSFEAFLRGQLHGASKTGAPDMGGLNASSLPQRVLAQGRYAAPLCTFYDAMGAERVHVLFFDDLVTDPGRTLSGICSFAGLDPTPYTDFDFVRHNASGAVRSGALNGAWSSLATRARRAALSVPALRPALRRAKGWVEPWVQRANRGESAPSGNPLEALGGELLEELREFYRADIRALEELLGRAVPWSGQFAKAPTSS